MKAKDFRQRAWNALNGKWGTMVLITLIVSLISGALGGLSFIGVGAVALLIVIGPLMLGVSEVHLKVIRGGNVELSEAFNGFKNFVNALVLSLLTSIFTFLWSLLLIVPGIIKSYSYSMGMYILADNPQMDGNTALKKSIEIMRGYKWKLFCLDISFIGWYILALLTFGILSFWITPYHEAARAEFYCNILRERGVEDFMQNGGAAGRAREEGAEAVRYDDSVRATDPFAELGNGANENDESSAGKDDGDNIPPLNADDL